MSDWPPALTLETEPVLKLFTGENFYSSADAALREAVLNAIDAIGRRGGVDPEISVVFDKDNQTIEIADNGDGMGRDALSNLFSKVGASAAQLKGNYRAVGEFGIGALSYFLVADEYDIDTRKSESERLSLRFSKQMLDGVTTATEITPTRTDTGTTLKLHVSSSDLLDLCLKRFSHWMRSVRGLEAWVLPEDQEIVQGGLSRKVRMITPPELPDWIESAEIGPPEDLSIWDSYDGRAQIDVLYRGVFVERLSVEQLWGLEGAIHVDPKHFRPMLNREGFVGETLKAEMTPFLQSAHPAVLESAIGCIQDLLTSKDDWSRNKAITLWLAVPRKEPYSRAVELWDSEFRSLKVFRLLGKTEDRQVSITDVQQLNAAKIYLAPDQLDSANPIVGQAIRVLRGRGETVVQGLKRDGGYLSTVSVPAQYSSWLLLNAFREELPQIIEVQGVAQELVRQQSLAEVYTTVPVVKLVNLGAGSVPFLTVADEIWINVEAESGQKILEEICKRNEGHLGLWVACMMHAPGEGRLDQVGNLLRRRHPEIERLGLVRRQYLRSLLP
ncbi:ATP-binding protein [Lentisalinibacter orientalis]|uniref:ATP-binding protein n=1 Tax=Lentisalinibacter orientalis TaxID=2992241 RepID=UPI00386A6A77